MGSFSDPFEAQGLAHFLGLIIYHLSYMKARAFPPHPPPHNFGTERKGFSISFKIPVNDFVSLIASFNIES